MAEPSNPHNVEGENPEQPLAAADEDEDDDGGAPGGGLPVLKWSKGQFKILMTSIQIAEEWGAIYPQEGDTGADAPVGYITLWAEFFNDGNLRLPVTVFVAGVLEHYHLHISQLSPFGMFRIRNFEYTFRAFGLDVTVENFRYGSLKLMTPPKGLTKWKRRFFYVKACAVHANMTFRSVSVAVTPEAIPVATAKIVDWFSRLRPIELKKLDNNELWVLRMMLTRPDRKAMPVLREKSGGNLGDLGKFEKTVPKKHVEKKQVKKPAQGRGKEKTEGSVAPPLVPQAAGIYRSCNRRYTDYVVVSDTLEGLGVPGGGAAAGGAAAGSTLAGEKRKPEQNVAGAGEVKRQRLQAKRSTGPTQKKPAVTAEPQDKDFSIFDAPSSPPHTSAADAGVPKESAAPFVKVVPDPTVQAEKTVEKVAAQIFDTVDSSNNLISPNDADNSNLRFSDAGKQKSGAEPQKSPAIEKEILGGLGTPLETDRARSAPRELRINQLSTMLVGSSIVANAILEDYKVLGRREEEAARLRAEAEELVKVARAGAEQLEKDRAAFEKQKQTEEWAATAELKQVRTLAKLLSDERKSWKVSWDKQNETLFHVRQELTNAEAANAALGKEKAAAEAIAVKVVEAEARLAKALEGAKEAGARAARLLKRLRRGRAVLLRLLKKRMLSAPTREAQLAEITARVTVAEKRANEAVEARDGLTSSFNQLETDREWMRCHGIVHIVKAIMDAPETVTGIDLIKQRARDAGFKAGYNRCIGHINILSKGGYTNERSGFRDVDTEALLEAVVASFYDMSLSSIEKLDECLDATDYVDRLRMLYAVAEEENTASDGQDGAGTSGTK
ncbi:hypothetical protein HanXRQr2_Chr11g0480651 [Helianthus annuus]|uniref:Transposase (Putative), gypsy type n=1 Tax=Helianthus annuus TaxID=4232 RepID=A0A9K3HMW5_HELAN|nr:hypothetical protein HanXRQr2_Chr11g0480651 [Helianthus annuus]